ncbi:MAG: carboxypeptidase-like regulatory domain-containing protein, partial [Anaerolineae bacterium]
YMDGLARWDADWPGAIEKLRAVYLRDPAYHDVRQKLHDALAAYGDSLAGDGDWCAAQRQYAAALQVMDSTLVTAKHSEARERCQAGEGPIEPTAGATARPGEFAGRLVEQTSIGEEQMLIRGAVLDADGEGIEGVRVRIQAFDWFSVAITDLNGAFAFDGLRNPVTYTLSLPDLDAQAVEVRGEFGRMSWVEFRQQGG